MIPHVSRTAIRRHWLFIVLLLAGAALRAVVMAAYPALLASDSWAYLRMTEHLHPTRLHPAGYPALLKLLGDAPLRAVPVVQHALGLGVAGGLYALQLRLGVRRWLAALAVAPLLLDAYWVALEQYVMSETLTLVLVAAGAAVLLWQSPLRPATAALAALALAGATMTRTIAVLLLFPAAVAVLALAARGSRGRVLASFALAALLPLAGYAAWFHAETGDYALAGYSGLYRYGRVTTFADCSAVPLGPLQRTLCPTEPLGSRLDPYVYIWAPGSPAQLLPEATQDQIAGSFARSVILHQPLAYARTVATDVARGFAPTRATRGPTEALWRWQFQPRVPLFVDGLLCGDPRANHLEARQCAATLAGLRRFAARFGEPDLAIRPALAGRLVSYRRFAYVPGPLLALALLAGAVGAVVAARRGARPLAAGCFLLTSAAAILIAGPIATVHFAWRYEILAFTLVPVCGALGLTALRSGG